ncbi:MAG: FixH family protein [Myxococcales bacterium]|nr:FixH family protein [Myxococcales bacterium]
MSSLKLGLLLASLALGACSSQSEPGSESLAGVSSEKGAFIATFSPEPNPPKTGENALAISLAGADGAAITGAALQVEPWMPAHGHGTSHEPVVSELGDGEYRAEKIDFMMPGHWELRIAVTAGETRDGFVVSYEVK